MTLPRNRPTPCDECPWVRTSTPGYVGPHGPQLWVDMAHSDVAIACHETIRDGEGWDDPRSRQCAGAAIFRGNVHKSPRDPDVQAMPADRDLVFASNDEFVEHHDLRPRLMALPKWMLEEMAHGMRGTKAALCDEILVYGHRGLHGMIEQYEEENA